MFYLITFLFINLFFVNFINCSQNVDLELDEGILRGFRHRLKGNVGEIAIFFGIPYAQPPIGEFRFKVKKLKFLFLFKKNSNFGTKEIKIEF